MVAYAGRVLAVRYSPEQLGKLDLASLTPLVESLWEQIKQAHGALVDPATRQRYEAHVSAQQSHLKSQWLVGANDAERAVDALARTQTSLVAGEVFRAVSDAATACRHHPHHPDYEATLAYARYRADVQGGKDRVEVAKRERLNAKQSLAGRRPWPHALVALGLLCAAEDDADAARWHLREALIVNPNLPVAQQLLQRLR